MAHECIKAGSDYTIAEMSALADTASNYTSNTVEGALSEIAANLATKVDKVSGKGLSTEDYTTVEKTKLAGLTGEPAASVFADVTLGTVTSAAKAGLSKFTIVGQSTHYTTDNIFNPIDSTKTAYQAVPTTHGVLTSTENGALKSTVMVPYLYDNGVIHDSLTEYGVTQVFSDDFFLKENCGYGSTSTVITADNSCLHQFKIPTSEFGTQIPKKRTTSEVANLICPMATARTADRVIVQTSPGIWYQLYSMHYVLGPDSDGHSDYYLLAFRTRANCSTIKYLLSGKIYIKYELETPIKTTNTNKLYVTPNTTVTYTKDVNSLDPTSISVKVPTNISAVADGMCQVSEDLNDLNYRVNNKVDKVSGKGLSTEDYTTAEKAKLAGLSKTINAEDVLYSGVVTGTTNVKDAIGLAYQNHEPSASAFADFSFDIVTSTAKKGLAKFSVVGKATHYSAYSNVYNFVDTKYAKLYYETACSHGVIQSVDNGKVISKVTVPKLYDNGVIYDTMTEEGVTKVFSDDFFIKSDYGYGAMTSTLDANGYSCIHQVKIPSSAFGDQLPKQVAVSEVANIICPAAGANSYAAISSMVFTQTTYLQMVSMNYVSTADSAGKKDYYMLTFLSRPNCNSSVYLLGSKLYIKYELATPIIKRNTDKLYVTPTSTVTYTSDASTTGTFADVDKTAYTIAVLDPTSKSLKVPTNTNAVTEGLYPMLLDINDLNYRVENVETTETKIGAGDGMTDDTRAIQDAIDSCLQADNSIKEVVLTEGTYLISASIKLNQPCTFRAKGRVVIKPNGRFPAIIVSSKRVVVDGFDIELVKYGGGTTDITVAEDDNGSHCGVYVHGQGIYYVVLKNLYIHGSYSYDNQTLENSYGIFLDNSNVDTSYFAYFNSIRDCCTLYTTYGLYIGKNTQPTTATGIINEGNKYPIYVTGSNNFVDFTGQNTGATKFKMASDGVTPLLDAYGNKILNNLTKAVIYCTSEMNTFRGYNYDPQRVDEYVHFTSTSQYNRYYIPSFSMYQGRTTAAYNQEVLKDESGNIIATNFPMDIQMIFDAGKENICVNPMQMQADPLVGYGIFKSADDAGTSIQQTRAYGVQDNALAYVNKWGAVSVYTYDDSNNKVIVSANGWDLFSPTGGAAGYRDGVTYFATPTDAKPLVIEIDLTNKPIRRPGRFGIQFNQYMASSLEVSFRFNHDGVPDGTWGSWADFHTKKNCHAHVTTILESVTNLTGIRIKLKAPYQTAKYNAEGYVGVSYIWVTDGQDGGKSYLPRGGGDVYGDICIKDTSGEDTYIKAKLIDLESRLAALES